MADFKQFRIISNGVSNTFQVKDEEARNALSNKVDKIPGKGLSTNDFTDILKSKLDGIESGATKVIVDSELSSSSTNPVQNKIVKEKFDITDERIQESFRHSTVTGPIASFSDGADSIPVKSLLCTINPVQDLHGYDNPWTPGGGKNKLPYFGKKVAAGVTWAINDQGVVSVSGTATGISNCYLSNATSTATSKFDLPNGEYILSGGYSDKIYIALFDGDSTGTRYSCTDSPVNVTITQGYATVRLVVLSGTVTDGAVLYPMLRLATEQDATYAPYSNICPISGFTGLTVTRTGKNLFNKNGVTAGYALDAQGSEVENADFGISDYIKIDTNKITVSGVTYNNAAWSLRVHAYDSGMTWISQIKELYVNSASVTDTVINVPAGVSYIRMSIGIVNRQNLDTLMVEYGATVSAYEPFGASYPITWQSSAGTVYGGTLDVVSGLLTVTMASVDLGALTFAKQEASQSGRFDATLTGKAIGETNIICSQYKTVSAAQMLTSDYCIRGASVNENIVIVDTAYSNASAADFKTAMSGVQLVYELATPQTYQLTPAEVDSLLGQNNLWHDANGDTTVTYCIDPNTGYTEILSDDNPLMNGTASSGISNKASRADHIHPHDSSKQDVLTFDSAPTEGSSNPVTSDGIYESILKPYPVDTASGSIASFPDGADELPIKAGTIHVEPVQDLHGYDNPWPGGGMGNLQNPDWAVVSDGVTHIVNADGSETFTNNTAAATAVRWVVTGQLPAGDYTVKNFSGETLYVKLSSSDYDHALANNQYYSFSYDGSSYLVLQHPNLEAGQTKTYKHAIVAGSTAPETFYPYSNICPISGWTGAEVARTGKNLLQPGLSPSASGSSTATPTASGGYVLMATAASGWLWNRINVLPAKPFAGKRLIFGFDISIDHDLNPQTIFSLRNSDGVVTSKTVNYSASRLSAYLDIPANVTDDHYISMTLYVTTSVSASVGWKTTYSNLQIEIVGASETAPTSYEPYAGDTYSITFPASAGTVYGGTLDVTTGKLTVDRICRIYTTFEGFSASPKLIRLASDSKPVGNSEVGNIIASYLPTTAVNNIWGNVDISGVAGNPAGYIYVRIAGLSTAEEYSEYLVSNPLQICYELATPIVYDLTPTEVRTLLGTNNIWADCGDINLTYRADLTEYINKKLAELQALVLENNG